MAHARSRLRAVRGTTCAQPRAVVFVALLTYPWVTNQAQMLGRKGVRSGGLCGRFWFPDADLLELTMRSATLFPSALGVERAVMQDCVFEPQPSDQLAAVVRVRPTQKKQSRCAVCGHRCQGYDRGDGVPRWRAVELGMYMTLVDAEAPRMRMQWGPLVLHSHRIESAKKLTHYHRRSSCLQEKQGTSLPGSRPLSSGISLARRRQRTFYTRQSPICARLHVAVYCPHAPMGCC